jgi:hypothetical protein
MDYYLYQGWYPLEFFTIKNKKHKQISLDKLKNYPIQTMPEIAQEINDLTPAQKGAFFDNIKKYYIVEKDEVKQIAYIYEVVLRLTIE